MDVDTVREALQRRERYQPDRAQVLASLATALAASGQRRRRRNWLLPLVAAAVVAVAVVVITQVIRISSPTTTSPSAPAGLVGVHWTLDSVESNKTTTLAPKDAGYAVEFASDGTWTRYGLASCGVGDVGSWRPTKTGFSASNMYNSLNECVSRYPAVTTPAAPPAVLEDAMNAILHGAVAQVESGKLNLRSSEYTLIFHNGGSMRMKTVSRTEPLTAPLGGPVSPTTR